MHVNTVTMCSIDCSLAVAVVVVLALAFTGVLPLPLLFFFGVSTPVDVPNTPSIFLLLQRTPSTISSMSEIQYSVEMEYTLNVVSLLFTR